MFPLKDSVPVLKPPFVTWMLIVLNVLCFVHELLLTDSQIFALVSNYAYVPEGSIYNFNMDVATKILCSMFLHMSWLHLLGNMWFLAIFGDGIESALGHFKYLLLYLLSGIFAALTHTIFNFDSSIPVVGASGAISGVLGFYFMLFPKATVSTLLLAGPLSRVIEIPAKAYLGIWFFTQLFCGLETNVDAGRNDFGTAFWAHIGGFVVGYCLARLEIKRQNSECRSTSWTNLSRKTDARA